MIDKIQSLIDLCAQKRSDARSNIFSIKVDSLNDGVLTLSGTVLEQSDLADTIDVLGKEFGHVQINTDAVKILRKPSNPIMYIGTNLTSLHASTSFLAEMTSQLLFGETVEVLAEQDRWAQVRQKDGYLGWTYKPYLAQGVVSEPTHIIIAPGLPILDEAKTDARTLTRVFAGTCVNVLEERTGWAQISANQVGWVPKSGLRPLSSLPKTNSARRQQLLLDTGIMGGVPYLWGGASGNGIDCSGFARLLHRWIGIDIPRDADMQALASTPVEPPYQPGDLFFFGEGGESRRITHVGVSLGGWNMMHSSRSRNGVYQDNVQEKEGLRTIFIRAGTFLD